MFQLTHKPSSVAWTLDVVMGDLKCSKLMLYDQYGCDHKECFWVLGKVCQTFIDFWDNDVNVPSVCIFHRHPGFKGKPFDGNLACVP